MKKKLTLTVLLLLLTGCVSARTDEPAPPTPTNELVGAPLPETTTTTTSLPDLSFLNTTTTTQPKPQTKVNPEPIETGTEPTEDQWNALAYCESGNRHDYPPVSGGFSGLLMFHTATWNGYGGQEYAPEAWQATRSQQIEIALRLWRVRGWQPWPGCRSKLGFN